MHAQIAKRTVRSTVTRIDAVSAVGLPALGIVATLIS